MTGDDARKTGEALRHAGGYDRAAQWLSTLGSAPLVAVPVFLFINFLMSGISFLLFSATSILFAGIVPVILTVYWSRHVRKIPYDIPERDDRTTLFVRLSCRTWPARSLFWSCTPPGSSPG